MTTKCKPKCEELFRVKVKGCRGDRGCPGVQGYIGQPGTLGPPGKTGVTGATGPAGPVGVTGVGATGPPGATVPGVTGPMGPIGPPGPFTRYSPIIFGSKWILENSIEGSENAYANFGFGLELGIQYSQNVIYPLILPVQLSSSSTPILPTTTPVNVYFRVPGTGPRTIRGLRWSIEYPVATFGSKAKVRQSTGATFGIWYGPNPGDGFSVPMLTQSALVSSLTFDMSTHFQSGGNLTTDVTVNGGDYLAMVLQAANGGFANPIYLEASILISLGTS